jgi:predicted transcriptional regulator
MSNIDKSQQDPTELVKLTKEIVTAYLVSNPLPANELPSLINTIFNSLSRIAAGSTTQLGATMAEPVVEAAESRRPAVPIRKSVNDEYIVCLEDGKKLKMLKRHLRARYNLTPEAYREKWGLPVDYPMVAPAYGRQRSSFAKNIGLGRGPKGKKE